MKRFLLLLVFALAYASGFQVAAQTPNDALDDTAWLQRRLDDLTKPSTTDRTPFAAGKYIVKETLRVGPAMGLKIEGAGGQNRSGPGWDPFRVTTVLEWRGAADKPMLVASGCTGMVLCGINFDGPAQTGLVISHGRTGALNIVLRDCGFRGMKRVGIQVGTAWGESTCANITYDNCHFEEIGEACVRIVNAQSLEHLFLRPQFAWAPVGIDVQGGGDVTVMGGGTYQLGALLNLGRVGSNARGFDVHSVRFDGKRLRTAWLTADDTDEAKAYGTIGFYHCSQNNGQDGGELPLFTVPPGCRVVARGCNFHGGWDDWARVYSDQRAGGELIVEYSDGMSTQDLASLVIAKGSRAFYEFVRCGSLYGPTKSFSTFPE